MLRSPSLSDLTYPEVGAFAEAGGVLAVPLGSTEQHGPHLPLSTDSDVALELCRRLAAARSDVVIAPPLHYGSSGEHAGFAGTLSIGQEALELLVVELVRSATDTFSRVVLVCAHGGNAAAVSRAVRQLRAESRDVLLVMPNWDGDAHAGHGETSMQLVLSPQRVRMDRAEAGATEPLRELMPALTSGGVRAVAPNGVLGDPTGSSPGAGQQLLDELADEMQRRVDAWLR
ncbi:MAG: mycofactocin precursor peptide peptidase [Pseudonocardiales bacterium]|nr:mycofactocin precursor peptide peptidase [Pseudonocardiales bacterium]